MRTKKTGSDLELFTMASIAKQLKELPAESRERVVNWVSSQSWAEPAKRYAVVAGDPVKFNDDGTVTAVVRSVEPALS